MIVLWDGIGVRKVKIIQMVSKSTGPAINGSGRRKCISWIDRFVERTAALESPTIFRRWAAIVAISSCLEQKVWLKTSSILYPNLYVFLVGHPGVGKTRVIRAMKQYLQEVPEFHFAPTSMTAASLVDALVEGKRHIVRMGHKEGNLEYNAMTITAEELTAFIHKYEDEMIGILSAFYDPDPYLHTRRGKDIRIKIKTPQLNIISGTTPSNIMKFLPEFAWDQGFTSRVIMVYSDERTIGDDFAEKEIVTADKDLIHDLQVINSTVGEFSIGQDYVDAVNAWRKIGEPPVPNHPKLLHYNSRRRVHLYKLSMIAAIDRGSMKITRDDFNRAFGWLADAESYMPIIFQAGGVGADAKAMDEIYHFVQVLSKASKGKGAPEHRIVNFARNLIPAHSVVRALDVMERAGMIKAIAFDKVINSRRFIALEKADFQGLDVFMAEPPALTDQSTEIVATEIEPPKPPSSSGRRM